MLDELFELDRDGGNRDKAAADRPRGIRGFFGRLVRVLGDGDDQDENTRRTGNRPYEDDDEENPRNRERRRRQDDDRFDFGDD